MSLPIRKGSFERRTSEGRWKETAAYLAGPFAIHANADGWRLSHADTGFRIHGPFKTGQEAIAAANEVHPMLEWDRLRLAKNGTILGLTPKRQKALAAVQAKLSAEGTP